MDYEVTDRGFKHYEPIAGDRGETIRVYESSAAREPCIWLEVEDGPAHLTLEQAERVRDTLDAAIRNHYQRESVPPETAPSHDLPLAYGGRVRLIEVYGELYRLENVRASQKLTPDESRRYALATAIIGLGKLQIERAFCVLLDEWDVAPLADEGRPDA